MTHHTGHIAAKVDTNSTDYMRRRWEAAIAAEREKQDWNVQVLAVLLRIEALLLAVTDLRSHEPPRNSGEGTAVNGPMPLEGDRDAPE